MSEWKLPKCKVQGLKSFEYLENFKASEGQKGGIFFFWNTWENGCVYCWIQH